MPCKPMLNKYGNVIGISCTRKGDKKNICHICGKPMTALCDATRKDGKPCDIPMCDEHRYTVGDDTDVCMYHNSPKYIKQAKENRIKREETKIEEVFEMEKQSRMFLEYAKFQNKEVVIDIKNEDDVKYIINDPGIREYFYKEYEKCNINVVPGHWPNFKTKGQVDRWISMTKKIELNFDDLFNEN